MICIITMMMSSAAYSGICDSAISLEPKVVKIDGVAYYQWDRVQSEEIYCRLVDRKRLLEVFVKYEEKIDTLQGIVVNKDSLISSLKGGVQDLTMALDISKQSLLLCEERNEELEDEIRRQRRKRTSAYIFIFVENAILFLTFLL